MGNRHTLIWITCLLAFGCSGVRHLKEGESLLYKQKVIGAKKMSMEDLSLSYAQKTSSNWFIFSGSPYTNLYYNGLKRYNQDSYINKKLETENYYNDKISSLKESPIILSKTTRKRNKKVERLNKYISEGNLFMRWGEAITVYDSASSVRTQQNLTGYMQSKGHFNTTADFQINTEDNLTSVRYYVDKKEQYTIDTIIYKIPDPKIDSLLKSSYSSFIKTGDKYDQANLTSERNGIDLFLKDHGYFNFSKQYINFDLDTTGTESHVAIRTVIKLPLGQKSHKYYQLDSVIVTTDANTKPQSLINREFEVYNNITYKYFHPIYASEVMNKRIYLSPSKNYSKSNTLNTQRELANMDIFKFVNVSYDTTGGKFIANIFTSPLDKFQWSNEAGINVTHSYPGPFVSISLKRRNIFKRMGIFQIDGRYSLEGVASASNPDNVLSSQEAGGNIGVTFPHFFLPIGDEKQKKLGFFNPKSNIKISLTHTKRPEYTRLLLGASNSYSWETTPEKRFIFTFSDIGLINTTRIDSLYRARLIGLENQGNNLINSFNPSLITSMHLTKTYNRNFYGSVARNSSLFKYSIEPGGTLYNLWGKDVILNHLEKYAYLRFDFDYRAMKPLTSKSHWAYKIRTGVAYPYGANKLLPYEKYFFGGGSLGVRAWRPRRLGPGSFNHIDSESGEVSYKYEQQGEILLEMSIEVRQKLFSALQGAAFIDAGNIWSFDDTARPGANFALDSFYKEIAIGTGLGLRIDFSFLLIRFDASLKVHDPARPLGKRFILSNGFNDAPFNNLSNSEPVVYHLAIGYPF